MCITSSRFELIRTVWRYSEFRADTRSALCMWSSARHEGDSLFFTVTNSAAEPVKRLILRRPPNIRAISSCFRSCSNFGPRRREQSSTIQLPRRPRLNRFRLLKVLKLDLPLDLPLDLQESSGLLFEGFSILDSSPLSTPDWIQMRCTRKRIVRIEPHHSLKAPERQARASN